MNKRELIKALFKNPTIKALYESGHFDAADINRAILTEAEEGSDPTAELQNQLKKMKAELAELQKKIGALKAAGRKEAAKNIVPARNKLNKNIRALEDQIKRHMDLAQAAAQTPSKEDDDIAAKASANLASRLSALQMSAPKPDSQNLESELENFASEVEATAIRTSSDVTAVKDAVTAAKQDGERGPYEELMSSTSRTDFFRKYMELIRINSKEINNDASLREKMMVSSKSFDELDKIHREREYFDKKEEADKLINSISFSIIGINDKDEKLNLKLKLRGFVRDRSREDKKPEPQLPAGKGWDRAKVSIRQRINNKELTIEQIEASLKSVDAFKELFGLKSGVEEKMAQAQKLFDDDWIAGEIKRLAEKANQAQTDEAKEEAKEESENAAATVMSFYEFLQAKSQQDQQIQIPPGFTFPTEPAPTSKEEFEQQFIAPLEKAAKEAPTSTTPQEQDYIYIADQVIAQAPNLLSQEDLAVEGMKEFIGWYVAGRSSGSLNEADGPSGAITEIDTEYAQRLLKYDGTGKKAVIKHINSNQDRWNNVFKGLEDLIKTNKISINKPEDKQDPSMEDVSKPELAELQENWTDVLMTFFGKNPKKSSFMRRLLLRSQAQMLYGVMDVLEQISDPEQMSAYTDMNQDDEREAQADKAQLQEVFPGGSGSTALRIPKDEPTASTDEAEPEEVQPEPEQPQPEPEVQSDKVELPAKTRRIIKQDLQSMVDLLRQLKLAIKDYSMYATRKSADPRFDGSKLKANMDELLVQVQDDIYDLHSNLKPASLAPETGDENLEEALNGIILEEDDPERQAKIQLVRQTYDNAKREYIYSLATSMEQGNWGKSQASAKKILDILKEEKFISLFPTGMKTAGGKVMTVGKAYESMTAVIQEFVETVRDIVLISKEKYIAKTSLTQAKNKLKKISIEIAELFRVPSKFSPEEIKQAKEEEAATPANKALTTEPETKLEKKEGDNTADAGTTVPSAGGDDLDTSEPEVPERTTPESEQLSSNIRQVIDEKIPEDNAKDRGPYFEAVKKLFKATMNKVKGMEGLVLKEAPEPRRDKDEEDTKRRRKFLNVHINSAFLSLDNDTKALLNTYAELLNEIKQRIAAFLRDNAPSFEKERVGPPEPEAAPETDAGKKSASDTKNVGNEPEAAPETDAGKKSASDEQYLAKIKKPVETRMKKLDLKNFGGKKEIQDFWTLAAKTLGELDFETKVDESYELDKPKSYGKLDTFQNAAFKSTFRLDNFDRDDRNNLYRRMGNLFEDIVKSNAPQQTDAMRDRMYYISKAWTDALLEKSEDINFRKQFAPFMRFIQRLEKNSDDWYRSSSMHNIRAELERIMKEKGLLDYIIKSNHNPYPGEEDFEESLEKALKPIIEKMLKEHYNH